MFGWKHQRVEMMTAVARVRTIAVDRWGGVGSDFEAETLDSIGRALGQRERETESLKAEEE